MSWVKFFLLCSQMSARFRILAQLRFCVLPVLPFIVAAEGFVAAISHASGGVVEWAKPAVSRRSVLATAALGAVPQMSGADQVRWGIIGAGDVCEKKSGPGFQAAKNSKLVAVMSRTAGKAKDYAKRNGVPKAFEDVDALLTDSEIDAVYLATPPGTHLELALKIAAAGKPCLLEKPMARNYDESKQIAEAFENAQVPLYVAYSSRMFPRTAKVKELLDSGAIGDLTAVTYRFASNSGVRGLAEGAELPWRLKAEQSGGGLIMDVGCHVLDRLDLLCGPLTEVHGKGANTASAHQAVEDTVVMTATLRSGALFSATWAFAGAEPFDELCLIGTAGSMSMAGNGPAGPVRLRRDGTEELIEFQPPPSPYLPLVEAVSAELLGGELAEVEGRGGPRLSVASAVRTAEVLDTVLDSYYGGRGDQYWLREASWPGRGSQR